jgi:lysozyme
MKWFKGITGFVWLLGGVFSFFLAYEAYEFGYVRFNYPSLQEYPVQGIDISHHQGEINWEALATEPYRFAYIKATEGGDHRDTRFAENWKNALAIGLHTGAYHFFTFCRSGEEQAENFIETVPNVASMLPPAIDVELAGNCKDVPDKETLHKELITFAQMIESFYGQKPIVYATKTSYKMYFNNEDVDGMQFWVRDMLKEPVLADNRRWLFWQYASNARLKGIKGNVDLNVFYGSEADFRQQFPIAQ